MPPAPDPAATAFEKLRREYDDFVKSISHDLGAPLRHAREFARLLQESAPAEGWSAECGEFAEQLNRALERAAAMQAALVTLSRLTTRPEPARNCDATELVGELLSSEFHDTPAEITLEPLPNCFANPSQLARLFSELIHNAVKFRRRDTRAAVSVRGRREGDDSVYTVQDNGVGVAPQHHDAVLTMFRRLHPAEAYPGVGAGLALSKKIAERHGGWLRLASAAQGGLRVEVGLPAKAPVQGPPD